MRLPKVRPFERAVKRINNPKYKVISFAPEDLLYDYPFWHYSDIFRMLQKDFRAVSDSDATFLDVRTSAQSALLAKSSFDTADLEGVYKRISEDTGISRREADTLKAQERRLAKMYCRRLAYGADLFNAALASGKMVILTADSVFSAEDIRSIMSACGYNIDRKLKIFVSSEVRRTKQFGGIYRRILSDLGIYANEMIQIGNNLLSDYAAPKNIGIGAMWIPSAKFCFSTTPMYSYINQMLNIEGSGFDSDKSLIIRSILAQAADIIYSEPVDPGTELPMSLAAYGTLLADSDRSDPIVAALMRDREARVNMRMASSLIEHINTPDSEGQGVILEYIRRYTNDRDRELFRDLMDMGDFAKWAEGTEETVIEPIDFMKELRQNPLAPTGTRRRELARAIFRK